MREGEAKRVVLRGSGGGRGEEGMGEGAMGWDGIGWGAGAQV